MNKKNIILLFFIGILGFVFVILWQKFDQQFFTAKNKANEQLRFGAFYGGKTYYLFNAYTNKYFESEDLRLELYSKNLYDKNLMRLPNDYNEFKLLIGNSYYFGQLTGREVVENIESFKLDGGTVGNASFIYGASHSSNIVAIAALGHEIKDKPMLAMVLRKDIEIKSPEDWNGKILASRVDGQSRSMFLEEFLKDEKIDKEDVKIISNLKHDEHVDYLRSGNIDGGIFELNAIEKIIKEDLGYIYRPMNWVNAEISQSLIVFDKDYLNNNREEVQKFINAYMRYLKKVKDSKLNYGENIDENIFPWGNRKNNLDSYGVGMPEYDYPPLVNIDLLAQMQNLMLQYGEIDKKLDLNEFIDHSFVNEAIKNLE